VGEYAKFRKHVNAHIMYLKGPILTDPRVKDIKTHMQLTSGLSLFAALTGLALKRLAPQPRRYV